MRSFQYDRRVNRTLVSACAALALAAAVQTPRATGGCLAPADIKIDGAGAIGPFWGADSGKLLYARGILSEQFLYRRGIAELPEQLARTGEKNGFIVGFQEETWSAFHAGAINERGDAGFIASTTLPDDEQTPENEGLARRGAYVHRGNTTLELGRYGGLSPVRDAFQNQIAWSSFFDCVPFGRAGVDPSRAVFSAQLAAPDGRQGLFYWDESEGMPEPLVLTGDPSPSGGFYTTFGRVRCNEAGDVVFYGLSRLSQSAPLTGGLYRIQRDALPPNQTTVARVVKFGTEGDDVPGIGRFTILQDFDLDGAGNIVFAAAVQGGPAAPSGLFRWNVGTLQIERLVKEGEATPIGGTYGTFTLGLLRAGESAAVVFETELSADVGGFGFFTIPAGASQVVPLGTAEEPLTLAGLGDGRLAYQTADATREILPPTGAIDGPVDFRPALVDVKNAVPIRKDIVATDLRFRLAPWDQKAPATVTPGAVRLSPAGVLGGDDLARIVEVRLAVLQAPNPFVFGVAGTDAKPVGKVTMNNVVADAKSLVLSPSGDVATWKFVHTIGSGTFTLDLAKGVAKLRLSKGSLYGTFEASTFRVALTLRTAEDVANGRTDSAAYFHRSMILDGDQPPYGTGRRVLIRGDRLPDGILFADALRVDRKLKVKKGDAAPVVSSDTVRMSGALRLCPGSTPPTTPTLDADVTVGDLVLTGIPLRRVGRKGSKYAAKAVAGPVRYSLVFDTTKGTWAFTATGVPPLSQLADADFSGATPHNSPKATVGGMSLPVNVVLGRTYETDFDAAIRRLPGGKAFVR